MQRQMEDRRAPNQNFYHVNGSSDSVRFSGVGGRRVGEAVVGFAAAVRGVLRRINAKHNGLLLLSLDNGGLLGLEVSQFLPLVLDTRWQSHPLELQQVCQSWWEVVRLPMRCINQEMQCNARRCKAMQGNAMRGYARQCAITRKRTINDLRHEC